MKMDAGFSLMEVLIALAITASLAAAGTFMTTQTLNASSAIDSRMESVREQIKADNLIRKDLSSVITRTGLDQQTTLSVHGFIGGQATNNAIFLSFIRDDWVEAKSIRTRSNLQRVEYHFNDGQIIRRAFLRPDPARQTPHVDRILYTDVKNLNIRYRQAGSWLETWPATADGSHPDLVEISIEFSDTDALRLNYAVGLAS